VDDPVSLNSNDSNNITTNVVANANKPTNNDGGSSLNEAVTFNHPVASVNDNVINPLDIDANLDIDEEDEVEEEE